ncbi:MAG: hypothetical protein R3185_02425, partial [Candidatus Thermoplasmatota archaeon]|nr:hypothetical protein [Candidatus Thermoplasmatota archaeon]
PFTNLSLRFQQGSSAGQDDAPGNLLIELYDPEGTLVAENATSERVKFLNLTATEDPLAGGEWVLRVKGDQGVAIGYSFDVEVHYLGLAIPS